MKEHIFSDERFQEIEIPDSYKALGIDFPKKSKWQYPYSYDAFVVWYGGGKPKNTVYTDRLYQWDYNKTDILFKKHLLGKGFTEDPKAVEAFLREWNDKPKLKLIGIAECCNVSSGYPIWILFYS